MPPELAGRGGDGLTRRVLVAGVGNVLRGDDGFGVAVARRLAETGLPPGVALVETGIGGMALIHELMEGYDVVIVVDAVDRGLAPGAVFAVVPELAGGEDAGAAAGLPDPHLAEPGRVLALARAIGALPERVVVVGCQPDDCAELCETLSRPVAAAVEVAVQWVLELAAAPPLRRVGATRFRRAGVRPARAVGTAPASASARRRSDP